MTTTLQSWEWRFGGMLADKSLVWAAGILALLFCAGAVSVWLSYRTTRAPLTFFQRAILVLLRGTMLLGLLLCLANPAHVTRELLPPPAKKSLAIMVDRSGSMTAQDNRGRSRLQDALHSWHRVEPETQDIFDKIQYFSFASRVTPADSLDAAAKRAEPPDQTCLATSLKKVLDSAPAEGYSGILCLTDGLDTTGEPLDEVVKHSLATGIPLYFLPSRNRLQPKPLLAIRELHAPGRAMMRTEFAVNAVIDCYSPTPRSIPLTLREGERVIAQTTLQAAAGFGSYPWSAPLTAQAAGKMNLELSIGAPEEEKTGRAEIKVVDHLAVNVLVYQGTLDWGYRFLCNALAQDANFRVTGIIDPSTKMRMFSGPENAPQLTALPQAAAQLAGFNIIVLANTVAENFTAQQQAALIEYTRKGGGVLFLESDTTLAQYFSGSPLEEMLPVRFSVPEAVDLHGEAEARFRDQMGARAGAQEETNFATGAEGRQTQPRLVDFQICDPVKLGSVLSIPGREGATLQPKFTTFARVQSAKAGARILAVHPTERDPATGDLAILMASQLFGSGRATVLTTDSLWRWKLSLPSNSRDVETFWQQLVMWLAQPSLEALRFVKPKLEITVGKPAKFILDGCRGGTPPTVSLKNDTAPPETVQIQPGAGESYEVLWTPKTPGRWSLTAVDQSGAESTALVEVVEAQATLEMANIPPDIELLRRTAESTGGELLQNGLPASWKPLAAAPQSQVISEQTTLLWNQWPVLLLCLGLYGAELILRRFWKLI